MINKLIKYFVLLVFWLVLPDHGLAADSDRIQLPKIGLNATQLAVIVNDSDPLSIQIANYYQKKRGIPAENIIHIRFEPNVDVLEPKTFKHILNNVYKATPDHVQAYALTWAWPFRVGCMSITTAFAMGFDERFCAKGCKQTQVSHYFNSRSQLPYSDLGIRPTMAIAATNFEQAKHLIDRGVASDGTFPKGTAYLLNSLDKARNTRASLYPLITEKLKALINIKHENKSYLANKKDILFYFTGVAFVDKLKTNRFVPGAVADHLTSAGGILNGTTQMSSLRWLEAGATGSYGAVIEPCNFPMKFPHPGIVMGHYVTGETLIEAYWKSVMQPGQGLFIGEPLAQPFGGHVVKIQKDKAIIQTQSLNPGTYILLTSNSKKGPYRPATTTTVSNWGSITLHLPNLRQYYYRLVRSEKQPVVPTKAELPADNTGNP